MAGVPDLRRYASLADAADDNLPRFADRVLFRAETADGREDWSALELLRRSRLAAYRMLAAGVNSGDPVLIWSTSSPQMAALMVGAWRAGIIPVPLDLRFTSDLVDRVGMRAGAHWIVSGDDNDLNGSAFSGMHRLSLGELVDPAADSLPADWEAHVTGLPRPTRSDLMAVMYTSGTTGQPRGVMLSHGNVLEPMQIGLSKWYARLMMYFIYGRQFRVIATMPLSHIYGMSGLTACLVFGIQIAFPRSRTPRALLQAMRDYRPTSLNGAPRILEIIWRQLLHEIDAAGLREAFEQRRQRSARYPYWLRRRMFKRELALLGGAVTAVGSASAYLPPDLQKAWESIGLPVTQGYGATECGGVAGTTPLRHPVGKVGRVSPANTVELAPDGEILVTGPGVSAGYWRDAEATSKAWDEKGRYHTGDVGQFDHAGNLILIGRKKNVIVLSNGLNVYPEDIEAALREHGLGDSVVVETEPGRIEAILLDAGRELSLPPTDYARIDAAVRAANATLTPHERVDGWRLWPESDFPRTLTDKIRRDPIRAWAASDNVPLPVREGLAEA